MKAKLNKNQANLLFDDIRTGEVKRLGNFNINGYSVTIYKEDKKGTFVQRNRAMQTRRKEVNVCVDCQGKMEKYVRCKSCRDHVNLMRAKRIARITKYAKEMF
jgi:hypothetical protein